jgi:hypothetical protein
MAARSYGDAAGVSVTVGGETLPPDWLAGITLTTAVPEHLAWASDRFISKRLAGPGHVVDAVVSDKTWSRPRSMKCLPPQDGRPTRLLDLFSTTITPMSEAVDERLGWWPWRPNATCVGCSGT